MIAQELQMTKSPSRTPSHLCLFALLAISVTLQLFLPWKRNDEAKLFFVGLPYTSGSWPESESVGRMCVNQKVKTV